MSRPNSRSYKVDFSTDLTRYTIQLGDQESRAPSDTGGDLDTVRPRSAGLEIFILSDVCFVREGLLTAFQANADFSRVLAGTSIDQAAGFNSPAKPRVVLLDAAFPNAKAAARTLAHGALHCQLIILAIEDNAETVIEWLRTGASGYVPRQASIKELVATVRGVIGGEQACRPATVAGLMRHISQESRAESVTVVNSVPQLTLREAEILQLLGTGCTNKQIARHLEIEVTTAKCHVHNILSKLHLQRRSQVPHWLQDHRRLSGTPTAVSSHPGD